MQPRERLKLVKARPGRWLPEDHQIVHGWIDRLRRQADENPGELEPPIMAMRDMVYSNITLRGQVEAMFWEALAYKDLTPLGQVSVSSFDEFLKLLNVIMTTAPPAYQDATNDPEAVGLIGFPINALLDWPMATESGYLVFSNQLFNQKFDTIFYYWCQFLLSEDSRYVLDATAKPYKLTDQTEVVPWLSATVKDEIAGVAVSALGEGPSPTPPTFEKIFECNPDDQRYLGYTCWDDFFTRKFQDSVRPIGKTGDNVVINACESAPLQVVQNAGLDAEFWLKGQPYSLLDMLNHDPDYAAKFDGGTVYQAFLSALSYHRWNSPVAGIVKKAYVVKGSYYLENIYEGFRNPEGADPSGPNQSQPFLTSVATRAVIFIEANDPIGLMCVVPVGMSEVSSCQITVKPGDHVEKGQELGMFHFGGSTHCLVFGPWVKKLEFNFYGETPNLNATNLRLSTPIATVT